MFNSRKDFSENNPNSFLPSPEILAGYEKMAPGATKELLEMVKKEQVHRHKWQDRYLESYNFTYRMGQIMGVLYILGLIYMIFNLIVMKEMQFSVFIMCAVVVLVFIGMVVTRSERMHMRKRPRQELMKVRNNNRPGVLKSGSPSRNSRDSHGYHGSNTRGSFHKKSSSDRDSDMRNRK